MPDSPRLAIARTPSRLGGTPAPAAGAAGADAAREREIVDELSQHLDDRYEALRADGVADAEARRLALEELREHDTLARYMRRAAAGARAAADRRRAAEPRRGRATRSRISATPPACCAGSPASPSPPC